MVGPFKPTWQTVHTLTAQYPSLARVNNSVWNSRFFDLAGGSIVLYDDVILTDCSGSLCSGGERQETKYDMSSLLQRRTIVSV